MSSTTIVSIKPDTSPRRNQGPLRIHYQADRANDCPGCGKANWEVGRVSAECHFCGTTLELRGVTHLALVH